MTGGFGAGRIEARGGEEDVPEALKGADVEGKDCEYEKSADDVAGPDTAYG